jgi:hypothetical protein
LHLRPGELQTLLGNRCRRGVALAGELHGREREFDAIGVKGFFDPEKSLSPDDEILAG